MALDKPSLLQALSKESSSTLQVLFREARPGQLAGHCDIVTLPVPQSDVAEVCIEVIEAVAVEGGEACLHGLLLDEMADATAAAVSLVEDRAAENWVAALLCREEQEKPVEVPRRGERVVPVPAATQYISSGTVSEQSETQALLVARQNHAVVSLHDKGQDVVPGERLAILAGRLELARRQESSPFPVLGILHLREFRVVHLFEVLNIPVMLCMQFLIEELALRQVAAHGGAGLIPIEIAPQDTGSVPWLLFELCHRVGLSIEKREEGVTRRLGRLIALE